MDKTKNTFQSIDEYIKTFPKEVQSILQELRKVIRETAPEASEKISYQIPTFYLNGNLVHFAAYKNHIGFYPGASGIAKFKKEIDNYKNAKGSVQFPIDQPLPFDLVRKIVKFRVGEFEEKTPKKTKKK
ncbi:iron chaperone [Leptospira licerasiae]|uniref:iron chaperone n=1 Tax=Leptospira licerasiae TaxID=447106 RepID=UPI003017FCBA